MSRSRSDSTDSLTPYEEFYYDVTLQDIVPVSARFIQSAIQTALADLYADEYPNRDVRVEVVRWHNSKSEGLVEDDHVY